MRAIVLMGGLALLLGGCTSINKIPLSEDSVKSMRGSTVAVAKRGNPDFVALTPVHGALGLLGMMGAISDGRDTVNKNAIADPADQISLGLQALLHQSLGTASLEAPLRVDGDEAAQVGAAARGKSKYVVDVKTTNWGYFYFPTDWTHYRLVYGARVRVIDTATGAVVAEGACSHTKTDNAGAPSYDDMLADSAAFIKKEGRLAAEECIAKFKTEALAKVN